MENYIARGKGDYNLDFKPTKPKCQKSKENEHLSVTFLNSNGGLTLFYNNTIYFT